jgi:hypothetical protein
MLQKAVWKNWYILSYLSHCNNFIFIMCVFKVDPLSFFYLEHL